MIIYYHKTLPFFKNFIQMSFFDLHIHSSCSDGELTPTEIVELARKSRLETISLTDHDTVEGLAEAFAEAKRKNINLISGIELSASMNSRSVHILGYGLNFRDANLLRELGDIQEARKTRNRKIIIKLQGLGIDIKEEDLYQYSRSGQTGRPHFAHLLIDRRIVRTAQEAFDRYLGFDGVAYSPRRTLGADKAITIIRQAGGAAALAHPFTLALPPPDLEALVGELVNYGLAGIEVYYPQHSLNFQEELKRVCLKFNLLETGGSDFHSAKRSGTRLGACHCSRNVPTEIIEKLKEYLTGL